MPDIHKIKDQLVKQFPAYSFWITRRLTGQCIVAKKTKYHGADIFVKKDHIVIEAAIPEWKTRFMLGDGASYRKLTDNDFFTTAQEIKDYLQLHYRVSMRT